jgi:hypothetical protein
MVVPIARVIPDIFGSQGTAGQADSTYSTIIIENTWYGSTRGKLRLRRNNGTIHVR